MAQASPETPCRGADSDALRSIPRGSTLEMISRTWRMRRHTREICERAYRQFGPAVQQRIGLFRTVNLFGPEANRFVMVDREGNLSARRSWELIMGRLFGGGLLLRDGDDHRFHRRILQDAFRKSALAGYSDLMNPRIAEGLDGWPSRGTLHAFPAFKRLTLDLACSVFLGLELSPEESERLKSAFEATVAASMSMVRLPVPGLEYDRGLKGRAYLETFFRERLDDKRRSHGTDMWSALCRAEDADGERLDDRQVVDHMIFLLMAAHDTTTSVLTSLTYELARHPAWQERVREESRALGTPFLAHADLGKVPSLALAMNETLRRYPPLSTVPRVAVRDCAWQGFHVPAGALVVAFPIHTHHMDEWWDEPFRWDPERFAEPRSEHRRHPYLWTPFSAGEHVCLGLRFAEMQVRSLVHQMVRRFRWSVPEGYTMPVQEAPISKPLDGLPVRLERLD